MPELNFQTWLDDVGQAFFDQRYEDYAARVELPLMVVTRTTQLVVDSDARLRDGFDAWCAMLDAQKVTDMYRSAHDVEFLGTELITGHYSTRILRGTVAVVPVFESAMTLRRIDNVWKAVSVTSGMQNMRWPITLPRIVEVPLPDQRDV